MSFLKNNARFLWLLAVPLVVLLVRHEAAYFPLTAGYEWHYRITFAPQYSPTENYKSVRMSLDEVTLTRPNGDSLNATPILHENGLIYYYSHDHHAIQRVALQKRPSGMPQWEEGARTVMATNLDENSTWSIIDTTYIIIREKPLFNESVKLIVPLNYRVVSRDATVRVAAGEFSNCLHIIGTGATSFSTTRGSGTEQVEVTSEEWYAPNVGMVKMHRIEKTFSELYGTNYFTSELEDYHSPL